MCVKIIKEIRDLYLNTSFKRLKCCLYSIIELVGLLWPIHDDCRCMITCYLQINPITTTNLYCLHSIQQCYIWRIYNMCN